MGGGFCELAVQRKGKQLAQQAGQPVILGSVESMSTGVLYIRPKRLTDYNPSHQRRLFMPCGKAGKEGGDLCETPLAPKTAENQSHEKERRREGKGQGTDQ